MYFKPDIIGKFIRNKKLPQITVKVVDIFKGGCSDYNYALCRHHCHVTGALDCAPQDVNKLRENLKPYIHLFAGGLQYLKYDDAEKLNKVFMWAPRAAWEPALLDKSTISHILVKWYR